MKEQRAILATVSGRVQGVGYRYTTQRVGAQLGLVGWVTNQADGTVRTWAQGPADLVARFIGFLEEGPPAARVVAVTVADVSTDPGLSGFRVRY
jgi:acylphosphatase